MSVSIIPDVAVHLSPDRLAPELLFLLPPPLHPICNFLPLNFRFHDFLFFLHSNPVPLSHKDSRFFLPYSISPLPHTPLFLQSRRFSRALLLPVCLCLAINFSSVSLHYSSVFLCPRCFDSCFEFSCPPLATVFHAFLFRELVYFNSSQYFAVYAPLAFFLERNLWSSYL